MPDPYEIIGVRRDASLDEIRIAYRRSAQVLHPDRFATASDGVRAEAAQRMLQLNSAMEEIEDERTDETSGTGGLGHVSFDERPSAPLPATRPAPLTERQRAAAPPPPPAPVPAPPASEEVVHVPAARVTPPVTPPPPVAEPVVATPEPEPAPVQTAASLYGLGAEDTFAYDDLDDDEDDDEPRHSPYRRPARTGSGTSKLPLIIVSVVGVIAIAVIAAFFLLRGGTSDDTFARAAAPFSFKYPKDFHARRLDGGVALNKPSYQVGFGIDSDDYLLASTYKLGFTVQADGSATGPKGQQLTPNQIDHDIDVTIAKLATQAGFTQKGVQSGSLGPLRARIYDYAKADGSLASTFIVALQGQTEYYVTCQSTPKNQARITKACNRLLATFATS
jgi:hypothetical protein